MVSAPFVARGPAAVELWHNWRHDNKAPLECLVEGPAGTGKTRTILEFLRWYLESHPGVRVLLMRDRRVDMTNTVLVEWEEEVLGPGHPAVLGGPTRAHRESYRFTNTSEAIVGGFNNEKKLFSGQYHGIYFNECQETIEKKWETLHRALRARGGPFRFFVGDCNPDDEGHWLNMRAETPAMKRIVTRLWDNPRFFDIEANRWTEDGAEYASRLRQTLTGANFERLYKGVWCRVEGLVLPQYDAAVHRIYANLEDRGGSWWLTTDSWQRELKWFFFSMDVGIVKAGVMQVWGVDREGRRYRILEYYHTGWTHSDWAQRVTMQAKRFNPQAMVCDHDMAMIAAINRSLIDAGMGPICVPADKTLGKSGTAGKRARIDLLRSSLLNRHIFFVRDAVVEADQHLVNARMPWCTEMEIGRWAYREYVMGEDNVKVAEEPDPTAEDHGIDATLYGEAYYWGRSIGTRPQDGMYPPGTMGHVMGHRRNVEKSLWK